MSAADVVARFATQPEGVGNLSAGGRIRHTVRDSEPEGNLIQRSGLFVAAILGSAVVGVAQQELVTLRGVSAGEHFGFAVEFVGDIDADGFEDFAIGAPGAANATGRVYVYSGRTTAVLHTFDGGAAGDYYGGAVCGVGDADGDGHDDLAIGAPRGVAALTPLTGGYVEVRSGATGALLRTVTGPPEPRGFGAALASGEDFDGDGVSDWIVGAPGGNGGAGAVYVHSGASGALLRTHLPPGLPPFGVGPTLGYAVALLGDVNGDGVSEYALGAPSVIVANGSFVQLLDGATGLEVWTAYSVAADEELGWSIDALGDVTGDGIGDLVVGARHAGSFGPAFGRVRVLSGATGAVVASFGQGPGANPYASLGFDVVAVGDLNGDGRSEFAGSAPGTFPLPSGIYQARATRIWSITASATEVLIPQLGDSGDAFGHALASGDANGDGLRDLLIGEPYDDDNGDASGTVHVYTFVRAPISYCQAQVNSQGCTPALTSSGTPSASSPTPFSISASQLINQTSALLIYSSAPNAAPFLGGALCVRQPIRRTPVQVTGGATGVLNCSGALSFDFNAYTQSGVDPALVAGVEVFTQVWSRDAQSPSTTNLSGGLAFYLGM